MKGYFVFLVLSVSFIIIWKMFGSNRTLPTARCLSKLNNCREKTLVREIKTQKAAWLNSRDPVWRWRRFYTDNHCCSTAPNQALWKRGPMEDSSYYISLLKACLCIWKSCPAFMRLTIKRIFQNYYFLILTWRFTIEMVKNLRGCEYFLCRMKEYPLLSCLSEMWNNYTSVKQVFDATFPLKLDESSKKSVYLFFAILDFCLPANITETFIWDLNQNFHIGVFILHLTCPVTFSGVLETEVKACCPSCPYCPHTSSGCWT